MRWSWRVARVFGIDINVHGTFLLLLLWVTISDLIQSGTLFSAGARTFFVLAIFGTVVLHELGHALTARRFGIRTRDITLFPIGGVARLERMPEKPFQELLVALAGPAVNVVLAGLLFGVLATSGRSPILVSPLATESAPFLVRLFWVNVSLAAFNLLPAFPMDGGRVLHAILASRMDHVRATRIAARVGRGFAVVLGVIGVFANPILAVIALFLWFGAAAEAGAAETKAALAGVPVRAAMHGDFVVLDADDDLGSAARRLVVGPRIDFPVMSSGVVVGLLTRAGLIEGLSTRGPGARVRESMTRTFPVAHPNEMLETVLPRLATSPCGSVPVLEGGHIVGIITTESIGELVRVKRALAARAPRRPITEPCTSPGP